MNRGGADGQHRIMHRDIKKGSFWVTRWKYGYNVGPSGKEVEALMCPFLREQFGKPHRKNGRGWRIKSDRVAEIIRHFGQPMDIGGHTSYKPTAVL